MALKLIFLGKLADLAGAAERELLLASPLNWGGLVSQFDEVLRGEVCCEKVRVALNGSVLRDKSDLLAGEGDEVAFLPPVSGG